MTTDSANAATVEVAAGTLRSRDGFDVDVTVRVPVRLHGSPVDRAAFADAFGPGKTVAGAARRVGDYLAETLAPAVAALPARDAAEAVASPGEYAEVASRKLRTPLFAVGLEMTGVPTAAAESPEHAAREAERAAAAAARGAAERSDELLHGFRDVLRQNPDVAPGRLLMAVPQDGRRRALLGLFEAAAVKDDARLFVAAGANVHEASDAAGALVGRAGDDGADLGPIRSLRAGGGTSLLCGCREGVRESDFGGWNFTDARSGLPGSSPLGFSDVSVGGGFIWACHGTRGLEAWRGGGGDRAGMTPAALHARLADAFAELAPESGVAVVPPGGPARPTAVAALNDGSALVALAFADAPGGAAVGGGLFKATFAGAGIALRPVEVFEDAAVVLLTPTLGVFRDGRLFRVDEDHMEILDRSFGGDVTAAAPMPWLGDQRVAACLAGGPVMVLGPDDDVRVEYRSEHTGFAAVAASASRLAAITADRERLVTWDLSKPDAPANDLYLLAHTRSRAADVAFA